MPSQHGLQRAENTSPTSQDEGAERYHDASTCYFLLYQNALQGIFCSSDRVRPGRAKPPQQPPLPVSGQGRTGGGGSQGCTAPRDSIEELIMTKHGVREAASAGPTVRLCKSSGRCAARHVPCCKDESRAGGAAAPQGLRGAPPAPGPAPRRRYRRMCPGRHRPRSARRGPAVPGTAPRVVRHPLPAGPHSRPGLRGGSERSGAT